MQLGIHREAQREYNLIGDGDLGEDGIWSVWDLKSSRATVKSVFDLQDILNLIISFADDEVLFKMSMVNKRLRRVTVQEELTLKGKDRQLRVMRFKFQQSQKNLDKVVKKMEKGELLDVSALKDER